MTCSDQSLKYLKEFGYNVVRLPRADIQPLQLFMKKGKILEPIGELADLLISGGNISLPSVKVNEPTANISGQRTGNLDAGVGLSILSNLIGAMGGGKIGLEAQYNKASKIVFQFEDVLTDSVPIIQLDKFLTDAGPDPFSKHILKLLNDGEIYIISSVIKSRKFSTEAQDSKGAKLNIDATAVKEILGPKVGVNASSSGTSAISFEGSTELVFGFKAIQLIYEEGKYLAFKPVKDGGLAANLDGTESQKPEPALLLNNQMVDYLPAGATRHSERQTLHFDADSLDKVIIAKPLQEQMTKQPGSSIKVIIDLNFNYPLGRDNAKEKIIKLIDTLSDDKKNASLGQIRVFRNKTEYSAQYVFALLPAALITVLISADAEDAPAAIYKIWPDFEVTAQTVKSISTIKADAARSSFSAFGEYISWAVADSGIDFEHIHFKMHENKDPHEHYHKDMVDDLDPFLDEFGHGTHVAGIIAGEVAPVKTSKKEKNGKTSITYKPDIQALISMKNSNDRTVYESQQLDKISGIAPKCKLVSIKVLNSEGKGDASALIAAIGHIQKINNYGRDIKIHGLNLSLGYVFEPEWFACGQSPLCVEVNRLVKSGVVVVAAAGNTGYGFVSTAFNNRMAMGIPLSINDPGNAELAITVGSTHRDMPHTFGISYFSSKGPTGDGRLKPDMVAPGEKIISCTSAPKRQALIAEGHLGDFQYMQDSGTSMAAPHVSGAIAAFLSIRREYIGQPEQVKEIFNNTATDLKRDRYFQGNGLIDLMRAIQSI
ncbi:S8 family peptidase [Pedobacter aquatilis]|uniref:gasdermin n=1 Tax=Pedobacter aquatilis TaxID=351343 RepID=UPI0029305B32|nr:S8 family peptidase [Pedobacter aquatilis]